MESAFHSGLCFSPSERNDLLVYHNQKRLRYLIGAAVFDCDAGGVLAVLLRPEDPVPGVA